MSTLILPVAIVVVVGLVSGIMLSLADKFLSPSVDIIVSQLREVLPGVNCGACGFAGCGDYAEQLAQGGVEPDLCTPGKAAVAEKLREILSQAASEA